MNAQEAIKEVQKLQSIFRATEAIEDILTQVVEAEQTKQKFINEGEAAKKEAERLAASLADAARDHDAATQAFNKDMERMKTETEAALQAFEQKKADLEAKYRQLNAELSEGFGKMKDRLKEECDFLMDQKALLRTDIDQLKAEFAGLRSRFAEV